MSLRSPTIRSPFRIHFSARSSLVHFVEVDVINVLTSFYRQEKNLKTLSELGHFLKGSSATLGLTKVQASCEKIQHFGQKKDETGTTDISEEEGLSKLRITIDEAKKEFHDVEKVLKKFYHDEA